MSLLLKLIFFTSYGLHCYFGVLLAKFLSKVYCHELQILMGRKRFSQAHKYQAPLETEG